MSKEKINNFESNLKKLEVIVDKLESGEIGLEESVKLYEEGMKIKKICDKKLQDIMKNIHDGSYEASEKYNDKGNYVMGANIVGFQKVANAMISQGIV